MTAADLSKTAGDPPAPRTVRTLLTERASVSGESAALLDVEGRSLSYADLLSHADRVTRSLSAAGIGPGDRVAVCLPDGPELAAAFLGISASVGCAPLNPGYREEELLFFLTDLGARALVVLAGDSPARRAARRLDIRVLELTPDARQPGKFRLSSGGGGDGGRPLPDPSPDDVALLLHTSGTTSRPKLVPLTHANLLASAGHIARSLELTPADRCLSVMPLFHIHGLVGALLSSLTAGGSVVCTPGFNAPRFFDWLDALAPTWYSAVPTMHQSVLKMAERHGPVSDRRPLRFIRSSSAALPPPVHAQLERFFGAPVLEAYGMTEASHQMASNPLPPRRRKPGSVGLAAGPEIAILDAGGRLLPPGTRGEVGIRGPNVTRGYDRNPEANERAFTGGWFRTGDEGVLDDEGYLTLTGRLKEIINRGGEKISPREIDETLLGHSAVSQAVAFAIPDERLGEEVGAAVVLREGAAATPLELREFVAGRLADFKVPRRIVIVTEIPKGPTGKLQRIGLAEKLGIASAGAPVSPAGAEPVQPRNDLEADLLRIWTDVLRLEGAGVTSDFFALGGDSLLASQIVARVRERLGVETSLVTLFETPTIAGMAAAIESRPREAAGETPSIPRRSPGEPPPLSFAQEGLWFLEQMDPGDAAYSRPANVRIRGPLDVEALRRALNEVIRRHEVLRSCYPSDGGAPRAVILDPAEIPLPVTDLSSLPVAARHEAVLQLAGEESSRPLDLAAGPLFRARLLVLSPEESVLLATVHHIAFDHGSREILIREIALLHGAFSAGSPSPLDELPVQYADFAAWERARLSPPKMKTLLDHWRRRLSGVPALLLPTDPPRAGRGEGKARRSHPFELSAGVRSGLSTLARTENASLFMVLLAGFVALLHDRTGQEDLLVATDAAARGRAETEGLIGYFGNMLLLRTSVSGDPTFRELLRRVREVALDGYRHRELPFGKLVAAVRPERTPGAVPFVRSLFVLHRPLRAQRCGATSFERLDLGAEVPGSDLALLVEIEGDRLSGTWSYRRELFEDATIAALAGDFERLLAGAERSPDETLGSLLTGDG